MTSLKLAQRLLWRDLRAGELSLLFLSLLIAITSTTAINLFSDRLQHSLSQQASEFLAADLAIGTPNLLDNGIVDKANEFDLQQSQTCEFNSVLLENNETMLVSVKAVSANYPLRGALKTKLNDTDSETSVLHGPESGTVWLEQRLLPALHLKIGDNITVGEKTLTVTHIISYEPDKRNQFYAFSPRVMINKADLAATAIVQPGSRVHYEYQFTGTESDLANFKEWLANQLPVSARVLDIHQDRPELGTALTRAEQYLSLSSLVVVVIAGVAIAMSSKRYAERHFDSTALLRCLGANHKTIASLYLWQFILFGLFTSLIGCALAWLCEQALVWILADLLPANLANPGWFAYCLGFIIGLAILASFALPPLLRLQLVSPLRVIRRDLAPLPSSALLVHGLVLLLVGSLSWYYTQNWRITATVIGGGLITVSVLGGLTYGLLTYASKKLINLPLAWRLGLQSLLRNRITSLSQIVAFSITLTAMALSLVVRTDLIANWQQQIPEQAPNHFALNIFAEQVSAFQNYLQQAQISTSHFYPVVRGRLVAVNDQAIQERVTKDSQGEEATRRELSLTWSESLPTDNPITAGSEWQAEPPGWVSVEQKLAESLHLQPGDILSFSIGTTKVNATIRNIRAVRWDTMRPNFYMIFSPGSLQDFPTTYLTSFYLPTDQKVLVNGLLKQFPATTIMDVDSILTQLKTILKQLTEAINLLLYFALGAGFTVLFAAVYATLDERRQQAALIRTLGAKISLLRSAHLLEFAVLGVLSGILATIISEALLFALYRYAMHIAYQPSFYLWLLLPTIGALIVSLAALLSMQSVIKPAPLKVLMRWG